MTKEKAARKAEEAEEATEFEETEVETEASDEQTEEAETKVEADEDSQQYKAIFEREKKAREDAEKAAADLAFKLREKNRKQEEVVEEAPQDEDKPVTAKELQIILAKDREATFKKLQTAEADRIASSFTTNTVEKQAILELHKNRNFPSHLSLEEQIEECFILANKKKILGENSELKRALRGKENVNSDVSTTHHDAPIGSQPELDAELAQLGYKWNPRAKRIEKKLPDGRVLFKDPKTKKTRLA